MAEFFRQLPTASDQFTSFLQNQITASSGDTPPFPEIDTTNLPAMRLPDGQPEILL
jgi:hypothetical protein